MLSNRGPWPTASPPQNLQYPSYYPGGFHTAYTSGTSAPPSAPDASGPASSPVAPSSPPASGPSSSPVTTPLTANAREFVPSGTTGPTPGNPSPGFPLFKKSTGIRITNPRTGEVVVPRPQDPANAARAAGVQRPTLPKRSEVIRIFNLRTGEPVILPPPNLAHAAGAASVQQPTHQRPLSEHERKIKARLEAEAKRKAEVEATKRRCQDEQEKKAQKEAEEAERLRKAEEEGSEGPGEARIRRLDEEIWKGEERVRQLVEQIRRGEEELRKQPEKELEDGTYKEREDAQAHQSVTPSQEPPLPKQSTTIEISNLNTGNAVVVPLPDPANVAGLASVQSPTQPERPLPKRERKRMAGLEAGGRDKDEKDDADAKVRLWLEGKEKTMQKEFADAKRLRIAEEEEKKREEEEVRALEEELKKLQTELRKEEDELNRREEERRKAEEELRKLEEQHRIRLDRSERARKEREEAGAEKEQKHELSSFEGLGVEPEENASQVNDSSITLTARTQARKFGLAFARSAFTSSELHTPLHNHDSSVTRGSPHGHLHSDGVAEEQENSRETAAEVANYRTLSAVSYLSKQMAILLQEVKDLRNEVQELRKETKGRDRRARSASPQRESSVPKLPTTATAINQFYSVNKSHRYFIMKERELDFCPGDVINILDTPQDTPRGWMNGEINVTKRGFFPDTFTLAQNLMQLAATPSTLQTRESLEIAVAVYQAALKLQFSTFHEPKGSEDVGGVHQQLKLLNDVDRMRRNTSDVLHRLEAKLDGLRDEVDKLRLDSEFKIETLRLEVRNLEVASRYHLTHNRQCKAELEQMRSETSNIRVGGSRGVTAVTDSAEETTEPEAFKGPQPSSKTNTVSASQIGEQGRVPRQTLVLGSPGRDLAPAEEWSRPSTIAEEMAILSPASNATIDDFISSPFDESPDRHAERTSSLSFQPKWKPPVPKKGRKSKKKQPKVGN
ncbi:hypothetical protein FRC00_002288 [Tulasnella sp. 408]|nr:hypothetical protein FRC00_002288 [Tulasnella sp. 408]